MVLIRIARAAVSVALVALVALAALLDCAAGRLAGLQKFLTKVLGEPSA